MASSLPTIAVLLCIRCAPTHQAAADCQQTMLAGDGSSLELMFWCNCTRLVQGFNP